MCVCGRLATYVKAEGKGVPEGGPAPPGGASGEVPLIIVVIVRALTVTGRAAPRARLRAASETERLVMVYTGLVVILFVCLFVCGNGGLGLLFVLLTHI